MRHITLISLSTPTFNNVRAASALPYHLIAGARATEEVTFDVYSFNINHIDDNGIKRTERELNVKINVVGLPLWLKWMMTFRLLFLRVLLRFPLYSYCRLPGKVVHSIQEARPDEIWVYGEELMGIANQFMTARRIVTMPDCESLYYYRMLRQPWATSRLAQIVRYAYAYWQYKSMEHKFCSEKVTYHFVGRADSKFFKVMNPQSNVLFLPHPLYAYRDGRRIKFHQPKVRLLFAGRYDFYCCHGSDELLREMKRQAGLLAQNYEITFLGKGWEAWNLKLREAGFTSRHVLFAPDYSEELQRHDIQINAIDVGTGTKGKVLDAIANGLLMIGTPYALENVSVRNGESCLEYHNTEEALSLLRDIPHNIAHYEKVAECGRRTVIASHDGQLVSSHLFYLFTD